MTSSKLDKYKGRIDSSLAAYLKKEKYAEQKARKLLIKRVKFLTSNTRLVNNKKNVRSGIYFSNSLITQSSLSDLDALDAYLQSKISVISNPRLQNKLSSLSYKTGFREKVFVKFSANELTEIVEVWKYASP